MRLGLMGGTFDPVHLGHLRAAESAREALALDRVLFVPSKEPPHRGRPVSSALDRFAMVSLATAAHPAFVVSDLELLREGPSFAVDTVRLLLEERTAGSVVIIVGSDTFPEMGRWKDPEGLFALCAVAVVARPGAPMPSPRDCGGTGSQPDVSRVDGPGLPVSATAIRQRVREGHSIRYLVPEGVAEYIAKRGLYR
jgi:nicotinate-nucleotide adenylyltransferase